MQQLFMTMKDERHLHREEMIVLNARISLLQKEKDLSRAVH